MEMMQDAKRREGRLLEGLGACACREDCLCPQQQQHIEEVKGTDEEIRLSVMDLIGDEEEGKEEEVEGVWGGGEGGRRRLRLRRRKGG